MIRTVSMGHSFYAIEHRVGYPPVSVDAPLDGEVKSFPSSRDRDAWVGKSPARTRLWSTIRPHAAAIRKFRGENNR